MFRSQTANLPEDERQGLDPDFLANEQAYLRMRDSLLGQYSGQWVAVRDGKVVASGSNVLAVTQAAAAGGGRPYIALVGKEDEVMFRVRRIEFAYDRSYQPLPMSSVTATFFNHAENRAQLYTDVIPDSDCAAFDLFTSPYFTAISSGVIGASVTTLVYSAKVEMEPGVHPL
jgi:hypothetical protein